MKTENLSTLKIHKLTKAQYERELSAGRIDENSLYLTSDEEIGYPVDSVNGKTGMVQLTASDVGALPVDTEIPEIPTDISAFNNDAGYLTAVPSEYITETELDAKGYLTEHQSLAGLATETYVNTQIQAYVDEAILGGAW